MDGENLLPVEVVDFFSGCGGTSFGLKQAGMQILLGIDKDEDAAATYRQNIPEAAFICRDIRQVFTWDLERYLSRPRERPVLFAACAPCQPFSKQNRGKSNADERATLLDELHRFVRRFRPEYVFLENVPGIQRFDPTDGPLGRFLQLLESLGYHVTSDVIDSLNYGVPQTRRRFVLAASLFGPVVLPEATHGTADDKRRHATVWDWIGDLPALPAGGRNDTVPNHHCAGLSPLNIQRIANTPEGGDRRDWPQDLILPCHKDHAGHTDVYGRLHRDRPASTLTTRCISLSNGRFGHPLQDRALSVREAACLQTFPRDFVFSGSLASAAIQVGNAVPVMLARRVGETINAHVASSSAPLAL